MEHYPFTPVVVYSEYLTGQTASIPAKEIYKAPNGGGLFRYSLSVITTQAGSAGTVTASFIWEQDPSTIDTAIPVANLNSLGDLSQVSRFIQVKSEGWVKVKTTVSGESGSPQYMLIVVLERLK